MPTSFIWRAHGELGDISGEGQWRAYRFDVHGICPAVVFGHASGRIYSREVLLSQVWGFDYYGGSRTVDVHVRRLRAKLGPEVAQHIETVRGAGYLWQS